MPEETSDKERVMSLSELPRFSEHASCSAALLKHVTRCGRCQRSGLRAALLDLMQTVVQDDGSPRKADQGHACRRVVRLQSTLRSGEIFLDRRAAIVRIGWWRGLRS